MALTPSDVILTLNPLWLTDPYHKIEGVGSPVALHCIDITAVAELSWNGADTERGSRYAV